MPIRKRRGKWHYRFWLRGVEKTGSTGLADTVRNRKAALAIAKEKKDELTAELDRAAAAPKAAPKPFSEAVDEFLQWCKHVEYRAKKNTADRIVTSFASIAEFFQGRTLSRVPEESISAGDVLLYQAWRAQEHRVADVTIRHDLMAFSIFFDRFALKFGWCSVNPVDGVKKPSDVDAIRIHVVTDDEERRYFERAGKHSNLYDVTRLMRLQGPRPEELMSLRKEDVDLAGAQIHIRGGKSRAARRTLDLVGESVEILARRLAAPGSSEWVFPSPRYPGKHLTKLNGPHDAVCRDAGVAFVMYDFRHTWATGQVQSGCDIVTLAAMLGHSSLRMVTRYVHPTAEHKKAATKKFEQSLRPMLKVVGKT
jgi:integrase